MKASKKLQKAFSGFMAGMKERGGLIQMLYLEMVKSGTVSESIVFEYVNGLPFPMTLHFLEPSIALDHDGFKLDRCPGVQVGPERRSSTYGLELIVCNVESMLAFLLSEGLDKELCAAVISADGRGAAFKALGGDDIRAWPILITRNTMSWGGAA